MKIRVADIKDYNKIFKLPVNYNYMKNIKFELSSTRYKWLIAEEGSKIVGFHRMYDIYETRYLAGIYLNDLAENNTFIIYNLIKQSISLSELDGKGYICGWSNKSTLSKERLLNTFGFIKNNQGFARLIFDRVNYQLKDYLIGKRLRYFLYSSNEEIFEAELMKYCQNHMFYSTSEDGLVKISWFYGGNYIQIFDFNIYIGGNELAEAIISLFHISGLNVETIRCDLPLGNERALLFLMKYKPRTYQGGFVTNKLTYSIKMEEV